MDPRMELSLVTAKVKVRACVFPAITRQIRALFPTATAGITEWALTQERMPSDQYIFFLFVHYYVRVLFYVIPQLFPGLFWSLHNNSYSDEKNIPMTSNEHCSRLTSFLTSMSWRLRFLPHSGSSWAYSEYSSGSGRLWRSVLTWTSSRYVSRRSFKRAAPFTNNI